MTVVYVYTIGDNMSPLLLFILLSNLPVVGSYIT